MVHARSHDELKVLAANVIRLSRLLTREREGLSAAYLKDRGLREAYGAYFLLPNLVKIQAPLRELAAHPGNLLDKDTLRVLDLGCGPGTAMLGVLEFFAAGKKRPRIDFTAVDQVAENLKMAGELVAAFKSTSEASVKTIRSTIEQAPRLPETAFNLIVFSNVLNEIFIRDEARIARRTALVSDLLKRFLADDGSCIIIEPALRETARDLLAVRDGLVDAGFALYAPCLCHTTCPALANPKDWCHEDLPWDEPELIQELDKLTGLRKDSLKFSYLIVRKDAKTLRDVYGEHAFRVVSEPLVSKGKREFYICGEAGRKLITRQDKDETPGNDVFGRLQRGDVVGFENLIDEGKRYKISKETVVNRRTIT
jgi:ribosomal protein RSM22 (predicted rRNA methylase)